MKHLIYMVASLSCGVLAAHYWQQDKTLAAVLAAVAGVFFMVRLVVTSSPKGVAETSGQTPTRNQARRELEDMLVPLRRNLAYWRLGFIALAVGGVTALVLNPPLGIALLVASVLPGVMFLRNHKAVRMIEDGLGR